MKMLMMISLLLSINLIYAYHPVLIMATIIFQALTLCVMIWLISSTAWFSFILFLIFIGGLMVLFIYITSLAANETFNFNMKSSAPQIMLFTITPPLYLTAHFYLNDLPFTSPLLNNQISVIFSNLLAPNTVTIMAYLLITLIVVVKIASKIKGPIRNMLNHK